jgi:RimJ/RimL family protein N-acetyltransferase
MQIDYRNPKLRPSLTQSAAKRNTMVEATNYSAVEILRDGRSIDIRALRSEDQNALFSALNRSSPLSLYRRFFGKKCHFTEREIAFFVNVDFINHVALVAAAEENGRPEIVGGGRYVVLPQSGKAEVALTVVDQYQGQGIGAALMRHLVTIARGAGVRELIAEVLPDNIAMLRLFEKSGLHVRKKHESAVVHVTVQLF